jgi:hypothetical protein
MRSYPHEAFSKPMNQKVRSLVTQLLKTGEIHALDDVQLVTRVGDLDDDTQVAFNQAWWPVSQTSMHHFGAVGPERLAEYQHAFLT